MSNLSRDVVSEAIFHRPPRHILLATDFTARCDRAQDRAVQLALEWNASLTAVHAIDTVSLTAVSSSRFAYHRAARRNMARLREEFAGIESLRSSVHVEKGTPATVVQTLAKRERADLIVTGLTGSISSCGLALNNTANALARLSHVPVLVVKKKVLDTGARMLLASDLTGSSKSALQIALSWFSDAQHRLFHAFDPPYRMWADEKADYVQKAEMFAIEDCARFITETAGASAPNRFEINVKCGDVVEALQFLVDDGDVDLVITGTHGRSGMMNMLLGSVASRIMNEIQSDVLVVPGSLS